MAISFLNALVAATCLLVLGVCTLILFKCGARARTILLILVVLCIGAVAWFLGGPERSDRWESLTAVATLLAVIVALLLDDIRTILHRPKIDFYVGDDLIDVGEDFDARVNAQWIRGRIKNIGDRGVERCRLKLLKVEGKNVPQKGGKVENGFLQWQGGIRDSMRLNPGEYWVFDIGTRRFNQNSELRLCAHFVGTFLVHCNLPAPGDYTLTLAIYGDNIPSTERTIRITIGEEAADIKFPPINAIVSQPESPTPVP